MSTVNSEKKILNYLLTKDIKIIDKVKEEFFSDIRNRELFSSIKKHKGNIEKIITECPFFEEDIDNIITERTSYSSISNHLEILIENNKELKLISLANKIKEKKGKVESSIMNEFKEIFSESIKDEKPQSVKELLDLEIEKIKNKVKPEFIKINSDLSGVLKIQKGDLVVLAARPSIGKSAFELQLSIDIAFYNQSVLSFSLEMKNEQLMQRILSNLSDTTLDSIRERNFTPEQTLTLEKKLKKHLEELEIYFVDKTFSLNHLKDITIKHKNEKGLDVLMIDYLQLMKVANKNRNLEIGAITLELKSFAKEADVAIILLSQLSREVEKRPDKRPILSDLRDSGSIEQDADTVIFLYRDEYYNEFTEYKNILEVIIKKQRQGKLAVIPMYYNYETQKISSIEKRC